MVPGGPLDLFAFFVLDVADHTQLFNGFAHHLRQVLQPIVNRCELFLDDALELPENFKQCCGFIAFDGSVRHKGRTLPEMIDAVNEVPENMMPIRRATRARFVVYFKYGNDQENQRH